MKHMSRWDAHFETSLSTKRLESTDVHKLSQNAALLIGTSNWFLLGRSAKTNEYQNLTFLFDVRMWTAFCMGYLCFISEDLLLWRIFEERQLAINNVQTFN